MNHGIKIVSYIKDGITYSTLYQFNNGQWVKTSESSFTQRPKLSKQPDHKVTLRDDLGLHQMLNNFDKVKAKLDKGQKEVYQDGWSIKER